jgi:CelD/BcsL family acetyltransferase involved in cellulose biosynthesis
LDPGVRIHQDWSTPAFALEPVAPETGAFAHRPFLETWFRHRGGDSDLMLVESTTGLLPLLRTGDTVAFVGDEDLTDYHSPLGTLEFVAELLDNLPGVTHLRFDSLPIAAADAIVAALAEAGVTVEPHQHEVAAVLPLPASFDAWLAGLGKKTRHEVRRKRRRFEELLGPSRLERANGPEAVATFAAMHRTAFGAKGGFMTNSMEAFFGDLHAHAGAVVDLLYGTGPEPVAAAFGFEDDAAYYLYNSAYDPEARDASPGIVLVSSLVARSVAAGYARLDFLKGDERYKFQHGAEPRPLYVIEADLRARP